MSLMTVSRESADSLCGFQAISLFRGELCVQRQVGHADDAVQRRPDLVAHVGKKFALGLVGHFRRVLGQAHLLLRPYTLGHLFLQIGGPLFNPLFQSILRVLQAPDPVVRCAAASG